jgi:7-cyano-7-deazaguanine synthase
MPTRSIVLLSGGLDSSTLLHLVHREVGQDILALSFDYGQRHSKELIAARDVARNLGVEHEVIDITSVGRLLKGSALTDRSVDVPEGHYTDESMRMTVVPNRNAIMLTQAFGVAIALKADNVCTAIHFGDSAIYPDCRLSFKNAFQLMQDFATEGFGQPRLVTPFVDLPKSEIVRIGNELGVPFELTYSCYKGKAKSCGTCGTCYERREAFQLARVPDPTEYANDL